MQMLLYHREKGVDRERLERFVFRDRDVDNVHHALQSVVYNTKRRLRASGLPDVNYIVQDKGVFRWTDEIPLVTDVEEFSRLTREGEAEQDPERKLSLYLTACSRYRGEFLPSQTAAIWATQAARQCRNQFCLCVERAAGLLREKEDYETMEELGTYASRVDPLADWETVTMESLVSRGLYNESRELYSETVQHYLQKEGLRPSKRLMEIFRRLGDQMKYKDQVLDSIQEELAEPFGKEAAGASGGGFLCNYPIFQGVYRAVSRLMERGGQSVYLMLCILLDASGAPLEAEEQKETSDQLREILCRAVRRTDVVNHYSQGQFLVLLVNTTLEDCEKVQQRVNAMLEKVTRRAMVKYYTDSIFPKAEREDPPAGEVDTSAAPGAQREGEKTS